MGSVKVDKENKLTISYGGQEAPFIGIDATKAAPFIQPNSFANLQNYAVVDAELVPSGWNNLTAVDPVILTINVLPDGGTVTQAQLTLVTDLQVEFGSTLNISSIIIGYIVQSSFGNLYFSFYYNNKPFTNAYGIINGSPIPITSSVNLNQLFSGSHGVAFKNINGTIYICGPFFGLIAISYNAISNLMQAIYTNVTINSYPVAAKVINELNGHLLLANLNFNVAITTAPNTFPFQLAWSAPFNYTQFEPLVGGLITGAGYNNLPDVEDSITGFINTGTTGWIIREQGKTEMVPLSSGIQPFDFIHDAVSHKGVGTIYSNTVCQYGAVGAFLSDLGITSIVSGATDSSVSNSIFKLIVAYLLQYQTLGRSSVTPMQMIISPAFINSNSQPICILMCPSLPVGTNQYLTFYVGDLNTNNWTVFYNLPLQTNAYNSTTQYLLSAYNSNINTSYPLPSYSQRYSAAPLLTSADFNYTAQQVTLNFYRILNKATFNSANPTQLYPPTATFPIEEVSEFCDVTIDSIICWVNDQGVANQQLNFYINGIFYAEYMTTGAGLQMAVIYPPTGPVTLKNPQLSLIQSTVGASCVISKITMYGTVFPGQRP